MVIKNGWATDDSFDGITASIEDKWIPKAKAGQKAPKSGRGYGVQGQPYCHGECCKFEQQRPYLNPYGTHVLCTNCIGTGLNKDGVWQERTNLKDNGRCKCCNRLPRNKSKHSNPK